MVGPETSGLRRTVLAWATLVLAYSFSGATVTWRVICMRVRGKLVTRMI